MRLAIIGSRGMTVELSRFVPPGVTEIVSGGADGIDTLAERYADIRHLSKHILRPDYDRHGRSAPLVRNRAIVENCDMVLAFWDGVSTGTAYTIRYARQLGKPLKVIRKQDLELLVHYD